MHLCEQQEGEEERAARAACLQMPVAGLAAAGPGCFLQEPATGDGTSWTRRHWKSLALPENADQKKSFPLPWLFMLLILSTGAAGSREAFPAPAAACKAPAYWQPSPGYDAITRAPRGPRRGHGDGGAQQVCSSTAGDETVPLQVGGEKRRFYLKKKKKRQRLPFPGLVSMGTGHQKSRNAASALK